MSLQAIPPDLIIDGILPYLPPRFIFDYQLAPIWFKLLPIDYHPLYLQRAEQDLFSKRYECNKNCIIVLMWKIITFFEREHYGDLKDIVPLHFYEFVGKLRNRNTSLKDIQNEITFSQMQFIFEFVSRYNFIHLGPRWKTSLERSSHSFEFSWVYAVDHYFQTHTLGLLKNMKSCSGGHPNNQFVSSELESLKGCNRIRGQLFYRNGQCYCELYHHELFLDIKKQNQVILNANWAQELGESFTEKSKPLSDEYFIQKYFFPALESRLIFKTANPTYQLKDLGKFTYDISSSNFQFTVVPSEKKYEIDAPIDHINWNVLLYVGIWILAIYFFYPVSNMFVFNHFEHDPYYWKSIALIVSDFLVINFPFLYFPRSYIMYREGIWKVHHLTLVETILYCYLLSLLMYYVQCQFKQYRSKRFYTAAIPWSIGKPKKRKQQAIVPVHINQTK